MENKSQLAQRAHEVLLDGKWIANTNFKDQIAKLDWKLATGKIGPHNTIAQLVFHIDYYLGGINEVFEGRPLTIRDADSFDAPDIKNQEDWKARVNQFLINAKKFIQHVERLSEEDLNQTFVVEKYGDYRRNIEGAIEHAYYHLGQISLIKKLIQEK